MNTYRIERIIDVRQVDCGFEIRAIAQGGKNEDPAAHGEIAIFLSDLSEDNFKPYHVMGKKREKIRIERPDRFVYVIKGWIKKMSAPATPAT